MKDVDPNGFVERRPKWKPASGSIAVLPDAAGQASLPLPGSSAPSTSPQRNAHVTAPPQMMGQFTDTPVPVRVEAQPVLQSLPNYLNALIGLNGQLLGLDISQPEGFMTGILSFPTGVPRDVGRGSLENGAGEDWNMVGGSAPLLNSGIPGIAGPVAIDRHAGDDVVTIHSSPTALHEDAPHFNDRGIDQVQHSQSGSAYTARMASGSPAATLVPTQPGADKNNVSVGVPDTSPSPCELSCRSLQLHILTFIVSVTGEATGSSRAVGGPDRHFWESALLHLRNTLEDLWDRLDDWIAAPREHTNVEPSRPDQFPNSHTRGTSIDIFHHGPHKATRTRCVLEV